ncbi:MAG: NADPH-dependent FMN reductase [Phormidesmis priestleyi Ana]|uniref:NADPH-dependent FMN reductase n=1 Tax=Phormidesmis priestleyi Ana TaxID=1666911 RepID=A0A0P7ZH63_9CYAN|nr:MAG: NADPH-dependent FMN reductase [Phormidesmis priestleyi Ana]
MAITGQQANLGQVTRTLTIARSLAEELKASLQVMQITLGSMRDRQLTQWLEEQQVGVNLVQGNTVKRVSEALQPHTLLLLIASTYNVGQPALGREPEAINRANLETNMIIMNFPNA